jgi:2-oxo-4-hydroxy-4-carboxy--5-ureidoimidazoline (OHCU) decarboxylase
MQEDLERKKQNMARKIQQMRSEAEQTYKQQGIRGLAPLSREEYDGVLALDKRYNVGKKAKK